jgi:aldose 1-epimerase
VDLTAFAPSGEQFELRHGDQRAIVTEVGATLRSYSAGERDVLDGFGLDERSDGGRGQVLIPWPNRLRDGRYVWDGEALAVPLNDTRLANAIHGLVRWRNWQLLVWEPSRLTFGLRLFPMSGYPFALGLTVDYELSDAGLRVRTSAENIGARAAPYGVGHHPYLSIGELIDTARLTLPAAVLLITDERQIPTSTAPVAGTPYDFRTAREIGPVTLDACFGELARDADGRARVRLEGEKAAVTLWMGEAYRFVMAYTGDTLAVARRRRGLAVEPMSCAPNAFASGDGLIRLEPAQTHAAEWGIEL